MGRWRSRLAELQSGNTITATAVQKVQRVQKSDAETGFEPFEPFEPPAPVHFWSEAHEERAAVAEHAEHLPRAMGAVHR